MISDQELYRKAERAGHDYRTVYGSFPDKIGISYERLRQFAWMQLFFMEPSRPLPSALTAEPESPGYPTFRQHITHFEPVMGEYIDWDEVYVPVPGDEMHVIDGWTIRQMAREKKRKQEADMYRRYNF